MLKIVGSIRFTLAVFKRFQLATDRLFDGGRVRDHGADSRRREFRFQCLEQSANAAGNRSISRISPNKRRAWVLTVVLPFTRLPIADAVKGRTIFC